MSMISCGGLQEEYDVHKFFFLFFPHYRLLLWGFFLYGFTFIHISVEHLYIHVFDFKL